ncbi:hypothetical protein GGR57DRAFT_477885 [Xylariaceae sp. FL1272]|nr:hypothetical protein GGR57DRAFT_477885 [Xylariaceae sp. FL1272]
MPRAAAKRAREEDADDDSDGLFVPENIPPEPKNAASKKKAKQLARLEEYDEDLGRAGSQNFQKWAKLFENCTQEEAQKSKAFFNDFCKEVKKDATGLKALISQRRDEPVEDPEACTTAFEALCSNSAAAITRREDHPLFTRTQTVIGNIHSLTTHMKNLEAEQLKQEMNMDNPATDWEQDRQEMKSLLDEADQRGQKLIEGMLNPGPYPSPERDDEDMDHNQRLAQSLYVDAQKALKGQTWGHVAAEQVHKLTSMIAATVQEEKPKQKYRSGYDTA